MGKTHFSHIQEDLNLQRHKPVSKTCMRGFMTQNGQVCPNATHTDGRDGWGRSRVCPEDYPGVSRVL